jgi:hypothetical protein
LAYDATGEAAFGEALRVACPARCNIRQSLFFAFNWSSLGTDRREPSRNSFFGIPISPIIAGAAMALMSVSGIANVREKMVRDTKFEPVTPTVSTCFGAR